MQKVLLVLLILLTLKIIYRLYTGPEQHHLLCNIFQFACPKITWQDELVAPGFESIRKQHFQLLQQQDMGSCVVAYHRGTKIVQLCGGVSDGKSYLSSLLNSNTPYSSNTLQLIYSVTKVISALTVAMLVDQGRLHYDQPVSQVWKEFGANGKENITVAELLQHRAGLWIIEPSISLQQLHELDKVDTILANQPHYFQGDNSITAYHAISYGLYLNALVRRVDPHRRTIGQFVRQEINKKLGVEVIVGVQPHEEEQVKQRLSHFYAYYDSIYFVLRLLPKALLPNWLLSLFGWVNIHAYNFLYDFIFRWNSPLRKSYEAIPSYHTELGYNFEAFRSESPGANGLSNAASLAVIASALSQGGFHNQTSLLSVKTLTEAMKLEKANFDHGLHREFTRTKGGWAQFELEGAVGYGWYGAGGALMLWNQEKQIGFAYVPNSGEASPGLRGLTLYKTIFDSVSNLN